MPGVLILSPSAPTTSPEEHHHLPQGLPLAAPESRGRASSPW